MTALMRSRRFAAAVVIVGGFAGLAGCALFDADLPPDTCDVNGDCFQAQGEVCNVETHVCEPGPAPRQPPVELAADAGVDAASDLASAPAGPGEDVR